MQRPRMKVAVLIGTLVVLAPRVLAQPAPEAPVEEPAPRPHMLLKTGPGALIAPDGRRFTLPQLTHILTPPAWEQQESEFSGLQERVIRLEAENKSLRQSASDFPWLPVALGVAVGIAGGVYLGTKI